MKKTLKEALNGRFYLDGGTGSAFLAMGLTGAHPELFPLTEPDAVKAVHRAFFNAGSNAVLTDTFGCNSRKADLSEHSLADIITAAVDIARSAADEYDGYVLYDCGPTGALLEPNGPTTFEEAYDLFAEQAKIVANLPVDGVIVETVSDLQEMRAAFLAFKENTSLPILCSMTFEKGGRTFTGTSIESYAVTMQALGADAVGINCGTGPKDMLDNARRLLSCAYVPVIIQPNAGLPRFLNGKTVYDTDAEEFSRVMKEICLSGVNVLGGCCGTTPDYIEKTVEKTRNLPVSCERNVLDALCSSSRVAVFDKSLVIGERLNPTGKPLLKQAILDADYDYMLSVCMAEKQEGADVLDVNLGMAGSDETVMLPVTVRKIQGIVDLPLCIDTAKAEALREAVRITCGRCLINSVNGSKASMNAVFPVAQKYGSYVVALCLDEDGIPETADGRIAIAKRILAEGEKYGIGRERFLFDPLTMAVSVDKNNALITLDVLKRLRQELQVKTTLGLSNVSFGLPNRPVINSTFYTMALEAGTSSAIINPTLKAGFNQAAYDLLLGNDPSCERYIASCQVAAPEQQKEEQKDIASAIVHGLVGEAMTEVKKKANEQNFAAVIDEDVIGGLNKLGALYSEGKVFLPQLIAGSEAAKAVLEYLKDRFIPEGGAYKATVILATVKGDVHDIGKNIVKAVVGNYGYRIIDLGKDVPEEDVLAAVERYKPEVVGLSALMTTTLDSMTDTVALLRRTHPEVLVMVGGAVVTAEFAEQIGASYSKDAREMAEILEKRFS
ncbi:MAG: homocysteine S-methyltransferase family protein [Clostridia bacterium]|nr:homocysteine S-methyltransferase family protein [Clostridia bacterium]